MLTIDDLKARKAVSPVHLKLQGGSAWLFGVEGVPDLQIHDFTYARTGRMVRSVLLHGKTVRSLQDALDVINGIKPLADALIPAPLKALTIWQPWASLIMIGAKPLEFREWDYRDRYPSLEGRRIVIHAGSRPVKPHEIADLIARCRSDDRPSLIVDKALPLLERLQGSYKCRGVVELAAGLGTAVLGPPRRIDGLFKKPDSDRLMHHQWAWPLSELQPFAAPIPARGAQGFWNWTGPSDGAGPSPQIPAGGMARRNTETTTP